MPDFMAPEQICAHCFGKVGNVGIKACVVPEKLHQGLKVHELHFQHRQHSHALEAEYPLGSVEARAPILYFVAESVCILPDEESNETVVAEQRFLTCLEYSSGRPVVVHVRQHEDAICAGVYAELHYVHLGELLEVRRDNRLRAVPRIDTGVTLVCGYPHPVEQHRCFCREALDACSNTHLIYFAL